ncbi:MAG: DUF3179 domain-containing protein [bacterium]
MKLRGFASPVSVLAIVIGFAVTGLLVFASGSQEEEGADSGSRSGSNGQSRSQGSNAEPGISGLTTGQGRLRTADTRLTLQHSTSDFFESMMSGGPPPDGIPSIDEPEFIPASESGLDDGDMVIGLEHEGVVRAYPQQILVLHEIVNQEIAGENVAVTYCPLTATAQCYVTGDTTMGVSGRLVNSNLVMYDRDTGSLWPQIGGTAVAGEREGESLEEVNVTWTTWGQWLDRHPDTEVLSANTGHARNYGRDPYGSYNPRGGYYTSSGTMFPVMSEDDRYHEKDMVVGARTEQRAVFFHMEELAEAGIRETEHFIGVYDGALTTGHIYRKDSEVELTYEDGAVRNEATGETFDPDEVPLERVIPIEGFYFAWNAFYPESEHP